MNWLVQIVTDTQVQGQDSLWPIGGIGINCTSHTFCQSSSNECRFDPHSNRSASEGGMDLEVDEASRPIKAFAVPVPGRRIGI